LPAAPLALVHQDRGLGDVEALDGRVEEVVAHIGDHAGDDLVAVGLGGAQAGDVPAGGQPGLGDLAGQRPAVTGRGHGEQVGCLEQGRPAGGVAGRGRRVDVGRRLRLRLAGGAAGRAAGGGEGGRGEGDEDGASHG
jgi:hypothetical protein